MLLSLLVLVWLTGLSCMVSGFALSRIHNESRIFAGVALLAFGAIALTGSVEIVTESGVQRAALPVFQRLALVLAVVNGIAFIAGLVGAWPVQDKETSALSAAAGRFQ
jgi:hypothetical protein